jgi:polar amino acid transport system substrate-binding protein
MPGYMVEIARHSLAQAGHTVHYQLMSWERAIRVTKEGKKNCVIGAYKSDAPGFVFPTIHQGIDRSIFMRNSNSDWQYTGLPSLASIRLGVIAGYSYNAELDAFIEEHRQDLLRLKISTGSFSLEKNMLALVNGELDAIVASDIVAKAIIDKQQWGDHLVYAGSLDSMASKTYIACSPNIAASKNYVKLVAEGTEQLRDSGELAKILAKYGLTDWIDIPAQDY